MRLWLPLTCLEFGPLKIKNKEETEAQHIANSFGGQAERAKQKKRLHTTERD